jgi:hypothetical protein
LRLFTWCRLRCCRLLLLLLLARLLLLCHWLVDCTRFVIYLQGWAKQPQVLRGHWAAASTCCILRCTTDNDNMLRRGKVASQHSACHSSSNSRNCSLSISMCYSCCCCVYRRSICLWYVLRHICALLCSLLLTAASSGSGDSSGIICSCLHVNIPHCCCRCCCLLLCLPTWLLQVHLGTACGIIISGHMLLRRRRRLRLRCVPLPVLLLLLLIRQLRAVLMLLLLLPDQVLLPVCMLLQFTPIAVLLKCIRAPPMGLACTLPRWPAVCLLLLLLLMIVSLVLC